MILIDSVDKTILIGNQIQTFDNAELIDKDEIGIWLNLSNGETTNVKRLLFVSTLIDNDILTEESLQRLL